MRITEETARQILDMLHEVWEQQFKGREQEYPHTEWERQRQRIKERLRKLPAYIAKATALLHGQKSGRGRPQTLLLQKKLMLFLFTRLLTKSNRGMEDLLVLFQPLFECAVSYKYIERLYADEEVQLALHNLFVLLVREEGVSGNLSGDGTGYSVTIHRVYSSDTAKHGKKYRYAFRFIDIETNLYVAYGFSAKSEMAAFRQALAMASAMGIPIDTVSLDKYYSSRKVIKLFGRTVSLYLIPKKNIAKIGCWKSILERILEDPVAYLSRFFLRNLSESAHSADKGRFGGFIRQRRPDRQEGAMRSINVLHNLYAFRVQPN